MDLHRSRALKLDAVEVLVLDEADRMLDMGFIRDIRTIVALLPKQRQTLFFSATMPKEIVSLADSMLSDPVKVAVTPPATTVERIDQQVIHVDRNGKAPLLAEILGRNGIGRTLVFTRTKHGADKVVRALDKAGIPAAAIHGNKSQGQRERALASFRDGKTLTLIATDIAARGIDVDGITHVVNFDLPNVPETYVHRIGRTARAGNDGVAISFCSADEAPLLRDIERAIRIKIPAENNGTQRAAEPVGERPRQQQAKRQPGRGDGERGKNRRQGNRKPGNRKPEQREERGSRYNPGRSSEDISGVHFLKQSPDEARARTRAHRAG
jgi:superfamily II DNA/RNA helicase